MFWLPDVNPTLNIELTTIEIVLEAAGLPVAQVALEVKAQVTASLFDGTYE